VKICEICSQKKLAAVATSLFIFGMITYTVITLATLSISSEATTNCYTYTSYCNVFVLIRVQKYTYYSNLANNLAIILAIRKKKADFADELLQKPFA